MVPRGSFKSAVRVAHGPASLPHGVDWRPGRVYFLTLLEPLAETTGLWPLPPGRPVPVTVGELSIMVDWFTAHAACSALRVWLSA